MTSEHIRLSEILHHLKKLRELLDKESPVPSFIFVIESKIRAYTKKYRDTHPNLAAKEIWRKQGKL